MIEVNSDHSDLGSLNVEFNRSFAGEDGEVNETINQINEGLREIISGKFLVYEFIILL